MSKRRLQGLCVGVILSLAVLITWISLGDNPDAAQSPVLPSTPRSPEPADPPPAPIAPVAEPAEIVRVVASATPSKEPRSRPPAELVEVAVRDIASGEPVPDLSFLISRSEAPLSTDETGILRIRQEDRESARPEGDEWTVLRRSDTVLRRSDVETQEQDTIWVYRHLRIEGTVELLSTLAKLDLRRVKISLFAIGEEESAEFVGRERLDTHWFARHRLHRLKDVSEVAEDGSFTATIPRIPGFAIKAAAPGWCPDIVPLGILTEPCVVRLILRKESLLATGTVKTASGTPLADVNVSGFVVARIPKDELRPEEYKGAGHGLKLFGKGTHVIVVYIIRTRTDATGAFSLSSNVKGELKLFVASPGQDLRSTRVDAGFLSADRDDLRVVVEPGDGTFLEIWSSHMPLKKERVSLTDLTFVEQPGISATLDDSGRLSTSKLLTHGHKYAIRLKDRREPSYFFKWDGQKRLDLNRLPRRPPWPLGD